MLHLRRSDRWSLTRPNARGRSSPVAQRRLATAEATARTNTRLVYAIVLTGLLLPSLSAAPQEGAFRVAAEAVVVDVAVYRGTTPITDLTAADFEVLDAGMPQTIADLSRETLPIDATLVIDLSQSVRASLLEVLSRTVEQIQQSLRPSDRATVITFDERIRERVAASDADRDAPVAPAARLGLTSLFDAIATALPNQPALGRRSMIIAFTDGFDTASFLDATTVLEMAKRASPAVFSIALTPASLGPGLEQHERFFDELADLTGGRFTKVRSDAEVGSAFLRAVDEFRSGYVLRYAPRGVATRGWHEITVRVKRPGRYEVRARRGYTR
jgi:VWFA-related protein